MKLNMKSLLTGTTLFVAPTFNINAVLPKGMEVIPGRTVTHPVFGEMKVISHEKDIEYYNEKATEPNDVDELVEKFVNCVINKASFNDGNDISKDCIFAALHCMTKTRVGRVALKVITANYMREYDWFERFLSDSRDILEQYRDACEKSSLTKSLICYDLKKELRRLYTDRATKISGMPCRLYISKKQFTDLYVYFREKETSKYDNTDDANDFPFEIEKAEYNFFRKFYSEHKDVFKNYYDRCKELGNTKKSEEIRELKELRKDLKEKLEKRYENEARFASVRKKTMDANNLLEVYKLSKQSNSKLNGIPTDIHFLRTLVFSSNATKCVFIPNEMKINLYDKRRNRKNFYISIDNNFSDGSEKDWEFTHNREIISGKYGALQHEVIHFLNEVVLGEQKKSHKIEDIIEKSKNPSLQAFVRYCCDLKTPSGYRKLLHKIFDNTAEMLCMYGIIWDADEDIFYYDPINEAVTNAECTIFQGEKLKLVRTGHGTVRNAELLSKLNRDVNIYGFYFDEKLRNLISE